MNSICYNKQHLKTLVFILPTYDIFSKQCLKLYIDKCKNLKIGIMVNETTMICEKQRIYLDRIKRIVDILSYVLGSFVMAFA